MLRGVIAWLVTAALGALGLAGFRDLEHVAAMSGVASLGIGWWAWRRASRETLKDLLAFAFLGWFVGFLGCLLLMARLDVVGLPLAAGLATVGVAVALRGWWRLRGEPLPRGGEPRGRVWFEGTAHPVASPARLPGLERTVVLWSARQRWQRWGSPERVELRGRERRVWVDPDAARVTGRRWQIDGALARAAGRALGAPANPALRLRLDYLEDGAEIHVVGPATLTEDPGSPSYREVARLPLFAGALVIGRGTLGAARWRALLVTLAWAALWLAAGATFVTALVR